MVNKTDWQQAKLADIVTADGKSSAVWIAVEVGYTCSSTI
jgi:hypothetical protein